MLFFWARQTVCGNALWYNVCRFCYPLQSPDAFAPAKMGEYTMEEQQRSIWTVLGPLVGIILLIFAVQSAVRYLQIGQLELKVTAAEAQAAGEAATEESAPAAATEAAAPEATAAATAAETSVAAAAEAAQPATAPEATTVATPAATPAETSVAAATEATQPAAATPAAESAAAAATPSQLVVDAFSKGTCIACHIIPGVPSAVGQVGPDLTNIGAEAGDRMPGQSAEEYIRESIVNPTAFTAPKCPFGACVPGAMPAGLNLALSNEELNAIVEYLLTLHGAN